MKEPNLRPAGPSDMEYAFQVRKEAFGEFLQPWNGESQWATHLRRWGSQEIRVLEVGPERVGIVALEITNEALYLYQLFLLPAHQGRGIGAWFMGRLMREAAELGLPVELGVRKANLRANGFYKRLGFRERGESDTHCLFVWKGT